jgi:hypothetical protein
MQNLTIFLVWLGAPGRQHLIKLQFCLILYSKHQIIAIFQCQKGANYGTPRHSFLPNNNYFPYSYGWFLTRLHGRTDSWLAPLGNVISIKIKVSKYRQVALLRATTIANDTADHNKISRDQHRG